MTTQAHLRRRARWESLSVSIAALAIVGAGIFGLLSSSLDSIRDNYRHYLISLAQSAATQVDPVAHEAIRRPEQQNGPEYQRAVAPLRRLKHAIPDIHFIYTVVRDGPQVRFVLDAADPHATVGNGLSEQAGVWQAYTDTGPAMQRALGDATHPGEPAATDSPTLDSWGNFMSGLAPLRDADGRSYGAIGVDVDAHLYLSRLSAARRAALLGLFPAGVLICILGAAFYRVRLNGSLAAMTLQESESRFRSLFELSPVGISLNDATDGRFLQVNDALLETTGYAREELLGLRFADLVHAAAARGPSAEAGDEDLNLRDPRETVCVRKDGRGFAALLSGSRITDDTGRAMICSFVQDISRRKAMETELAEAARHDKLTGLPTRTVFMERLERAIRRQRNHELPLFAVLFLDFDRFKQVNDTLGHNAGDELLRQIAARLQAALRRTDALHAPAAANLVSRFGGDEFLVLIESLGGPEDAVSCGERLLHALEPAYTLFDSEVHSSASVGIVISRDGDASAEELVRNADLAMYEAKRAGRARGVVFNEAMHTRLLRHVAVEAGLRRAIGTPEMFLVYQPIVDLRTGRRCSVEALARWNHPTLGPISPAEFIPIAEESGLIGELGQWVLKTACQDMARWRFEDPARAPDTVSINVSRAEIALGSSLREQISAELRRTGLPPECLTLEITEREFMRNPQTALTLLQELRELGIQLAMDDFGTGTSSLALLRQYPFDTIKIDRSFVQDLATDKDVLPVIHATITLVENLGMNSLAEGVEEPSQVAVLQSLGCRYAQGFIFSVPVLAEQVLDRLMPAETPVRAAAS